MGRVIKDGDREPPLKVTIADEDNQADLNGVTSWRLLLQRAGSTTTTVYTSTAGEITVAVDATDNWKATVTHPLEAADVTATEKVRVYGEVEATWPGGNTQTFPNQGYFYYDLVPDLG